VIPLKDDNPTRTVPLVTVILILTNVAAYLWQSFLPGEAGARATLRLALVPADLTSPATFDAPALLQVGTVLLTHMFLHASVMHILGNMVYLWIFGNNVEDLMGHGRFLVFYLVCGLAAALAQVAVVPHSTVPMVGASGAVSGVLGAYLILFPAARVLTLVFVFIFIRIVAVPAVIVLGFWFLIQLLNAGQTRGPGVAWFAHIGGFVAGLLLVALFRRRRPRGSLY
jgi:membrane associated rhomboid family serine protease